MPLSVLIVAGDPSGDLHASHLVLALKRARPDVTITAVGGEALRRVADMFLEDLASRGVTGFVEPLRQLRFLRALSDRLRRLVRDERPDAVICVDYYGFNRRVLELARRAGVPAFYYISPQVWASRPRRVQVLKRLVRRMLVIFPFEERIYRDADVPVTFVGHPMLDLIRDSGLGIRDSGGVRASASAPRSAEPTFRSVETAPPSDVGLLPGSRRSELRRHLPVLLAAFARLRSTRPHLRAQIFAASSLPDSAYGILPEGVTLVRERDYTQRARLDLALCSSGTATLENALLGVPMVVIYRLSWPTYLIARLVVTVPQIAMVNVLAGRALVPELIQHAATPARIADAAAPLLDDPARASHMRAELLALRSMLGEEGAADRAAAAVLDDLGSV